MFKRAYLLIIEPEKTWRAIGQESVVIRQILIGYALPMMLVPTASMIVRILFSRLSFITLSFLFSLLIGALVNFILSAAALLFAGWLISLMAPYFGAKNDPAATLKIVVYSMTPVWLCSVFKIFPPLSVLSILGLYGTFLVFTGVPILLAPPPEKNLPFALSIVGLGLVLLAYLSMIAGGLFYL